MSLSKLVAGRLEGSFEDFVSRCERAIEDEQNKANPDNYLIKIFSDAIRVVDEHIEYVSNSIPPTP